MQHPIQTFEANQEGRDFVVGDLHGCIERLNQLLDHVEFDKTKDRLFSVGDLIDRGADSLECLKLLYEPWFHSVVANHEEMMVDAFRGGYMGSFWLRNGGMWGSTALTAHHAAQRRKLDPTVEARVPFDDERELLDLLPIVDELPYLITVKQKNGKRIHIIHAEFPPVSKITDEDLANPHTVLDLAGEQAVDGGHMIWGRHLFYNFYRSDLSNTKKIVRTCAYTFRNTIFNDKLSHIISGHTIVQRPLTILGQTNIDTCAYGSTASDAKPWEALTMVEIDSWKFYQARSTGVSEVEPFVVSDADIAELAQPKTIKSEPPPFNLDLERVPVLNNVIELGQK